MEPELITGVYGEVSGLPAPVSAHVSEEQLPELRIYTVAAGELLATVSLQRWNVTKYIYSSTTLKYKF